MPEQKTVRVRIAVAIGDDGQWNCCGWRGCADEDARGIASDTLESEQFVIHWVEADIPVPQPQTIEGAGTQ